MKNYIYKYRQVIMLCVVGLFLVAGVIQYAVGLTYVLRLTPILLAIIAAMALLVWDALPGRKALLALIVVLSGFVIEQIGVHTGLLFGDYQYGTGLGLKLWGVPVTIGITWLVVTLSAWHIVSFGKLVNWQKFLLAGTLVVMFDLILEQFAVVFGLWSWQGGSIPLINYITWFAVSELYFYEYYRLAKPLVPSIFIAGLLPLMAMFFWLMLLVY